MRPVQVFGVVMRTFGLALLIYSLWYLLYGVATVFGLPEFRAGFKVGYFLSGSLFLVVSIYLLRGAPHLMKFCYPEK